MSGTTAIAIYAAVIATAGLAWQIYSWRRSQPTRIRVTVTNAVIPPNGNHAAMITAVNQSDHLVKVTSVGFITQDGSKRDVLLMQPPFGATLPGPVAQRDSGVSWLEVQDCLTAGLDVYRPLVGWVRTSEGQRYESKPTTLMRR
jgi:hypothetical protein